MKHRQKVLIFQIGGLGDTVVSVPCYREIARRHAASDRYVLTNFATGAKMVQAESLLRPCGLVEGAIRYPMPLRGVRNIFELWGTLRSAHFDALYYLCPEKRLSNLIRHYIFFKLCGIKRVCGVPWRRDRRFPLFIESTGIWESEASRLLRNIRGSAEPEVPTRGERSLSITSSEREAAEHFLNQNPDVRRFVVVSVGGRVPIKDWGDDNWRRVLSGISKAHPGLALVFVGSDDERKRAEDLASAWEGPTMISCGQTTPRETAALIERAALFLGHDTGTLHLAAAVQTRIIGLFSARDVPGKWYSDQTDDVFFYNKVPCFGCRLTEVSDCPNERACMTQHSVDEIVAVATVTLSPVGVSSRIQTSLSRSQPVDVV